MPAGAKITALLRQRARRYRRRLTFAPGQPSGLTMSRCVKSKLQFHVLSIQHVAINFRIRIHKEVQRRSALLWLQHKVSPGGKRDSISRYVSEIVLLHSRMLVGFGNIHRHPAFAVDMKPTPTVIAANEPRLNVRRNRKADFKSRVNSLRTRKRYEQTVKVSAVSESTVAHPFRITLPPAFSIFAVFHVVVHKIINRSRPLDGI